MANVYRFDRDLGSVTPIEAFYVPSGASQGDMMQWDSSAKIATNNLLSSGSIFLGVCEDASPVAGIGTSTRTLTNNRLRVKMGQCVMRFKTTASETYVHRTVVYQGADAQTVSTVGATRAIGLVWLPDGSTVTGASGTEVTVLILPNGMQATGATY